MAAVDADIAGGRRPLRLPTDSPPPRGRIDVMPVAFGEEDGAAAARVLLASDRLPTAVIGCSDHCGAGLVATFARAGVTVPDTISVTGYDDSNIAPVVQRPHRRPPRRRPHRRRHPLGDPAPTHRPDIGATGAPDRGDAHQRSTTGPPRRR
jgi:hypothetical protein